MIIDFIEWFRKPDTIEVFTNGMCYWFAKILELRFGGEILYATSYGHFVCRIDGRLYDVTGDVSNQYVEGLISWNDMPEYDELLYERLVRDCVRKI